MDVIFAHGVFWGPCAPTNPSRHSPQVLSRVEHDSLLYFPQLVAPEQFTLLTMFPINTMEAEEVLFDSCDLMKDSTAEGSPGVT
jgi:hypothetical protein